MPYPNYHAARIINPDEFEQDSFRTKEITEGVEIIIGKLKNGNGSMVTQAYHFNKDNYTADEAKAWLKKHDIKYIEFTPATETKSIDMTNEERAVVTAMEAKRKELGQSVDEFYAIPRDPPSESKLPIFDEEHVRNAMARFSQVQGVSAEEKVKAKSKIIAKAKHFGIDTINFEKEGRNIDSLNIEVRIIANEDSEVRYLPDSRNVEGYGIVFNSESLLLTGELKGGQKVQFRERILPTAINGVIEQSDILALMNHDIKRGILARYNRGKGSMKLDVDSKGVKYAFESPKTTLGDELLEGIKRGDIKSSSFAFDVTNGQKWEKRSDGSYLRTIIKFEGIYDISPCYHEAYQDTSVALRNLEEFKNTKVEDLIPEETKPITAKPLVEPIVKKEEVKDKSKDEPRNTNLKNNKMTLEELKDKRAKALEENDKSMKPKWLKIEL